MRSLARVVLASLVVSLVWGCSPDDEGSPGVAELAELCGVTQPVQILALDPSRPLAGHFHHGIIDSRRIVRVDYGEGQIPLLPSVPNIEANEVWSVGLCGEDPRLLAGPDAYVLDLSEFWRDDLFSCEGATQRTSILDPTGERPSAVVFEGDCRPTPSAFGLITKQDEGEGAMTLILQRWPEDPWTSKAEAVVLLEGVQPSEFWVDADEVLATTTTRELVAVSLVDLAITPIAGEIVDTRHDSKGRYLLVETGVGEDGDTLALLDRETGTWRTMGTGRLSWSGDPFVLVDLGYLYLRVGSSATSRLHALTGDATLDLPSNLEPRLPLGDSHALLDEDFEGPFWTLDLATGEGRPLPIGTGQPWWPDDLVHLLELDANDTLAEGPAWRISSEGEPELVARRVTDAVRRSSDGRLITPVDVDENWVGELIVIDPDTLAEQRIDSDVRVWRPALDEREGQVIVNYARVGPEVQGVWLARLPD